jgi:hypothetical protein
VRAANGSRLIKATIALAIAEACLCLFLFLLSAGPDAAQGGVSESGAHAICPAAHYRTALLPIVPVSHTD